MTFRAAVILVAGRQIGVVQVQQNAFNSDATQEEISVLAKCLLGIDHVALMMLDENNIPTFIGSKDETNLLPDSDFENYPWKEYPYPQE